MSCYLTGTILELKWTRESHEDAVEGSSNHSKLLNVNSERLGRITLKDKPLMASSSDETEVCHSPELPVFEYFDWDQPHFRPPIFDKASSLI